VSWRRIPLWVVALVLVCWRASAHEVRPAYLEIAAADDDVYAVMWKQPVLAEVRIAIDPRLPESCTPLGERSVERTGSALIARWRVRCPGGLHGKTVHIDGLQRTLTSAFVRVELPGGDVISGAVRGADPTFVIADARPALLAYVALGIEHIFTGADHVAFVIGLILLVAGFWKLVQALTAFTVAHSVTLGAASLGAVGVPQAATEVVIALSIVVVGYEVVRSSRGSSGLTSAMPWLVAFGFGLLHGFGFAGVLAQIGLPPRSELAALLLFNVGVEAGQLAIVAIVVPIAHWARNRPRVVRTRFEHGAGYALGIAGTFWMIERVATAL
jgi:hydrogenase/urease accessory protein HupE